MALQKSNSAIITSSECTHTVRTPYLEDPDGFQILLRTFINTWTQGEDDVSAMGKRMKHLKDYMFRFLIIGQLKVSEYICRPQQRGFQNQMAMGFYPGNIIEDDFQDRHMSMRWIQDVHGHIRWKHDPSGWKQDRQDQKQDCSGVKDTCNGSGGSFVLPCLGEDRVVIDSHRRIIFDITVVLGYTVSSKTSHMEHSLKRLVSRPLEIQDKYIPKVLLGNGTIKGVPRRLEKVIYVILTSSKPTHTIRTPYLEDHDGSLPLPRTMINT